MKEKDSCNGFIVRYPKDLSLKQEKKDTSVAAGVVAVPFVSPAPVLPVPCVAARLLSEIF